MLVALGAGLTAPTLAQRKNTERKPISVLPTPPTQRKTGERNPAATDQAGSIAVTGSAPGVVVTPAVQELVVSSSFVTVIVPAESETLLRNTRSACRTVLTTDEPLSVPVDISR